ncbi:MAG: hypothetical protein ABL982_26050 [Vicinamibacterales bacterium]
MNHSTGNDSPKSEPAGDSLERVLEFLTFLEGKGVHFQIDQVRPDAILVFFTLVGVRVEVDFFVGRMEYRCFRGNEDVLEDQALLLELIRIQTT